MKNISQILNLLLAAALVILSVKILFQDKNNNSNNDKTADAMEVIMTRTSVRSYTDKKVEPDKIESMLRAAMAAPTAGNKQPWAFIVVTEKDILNKLGDILPHAKMTSNAPLAIVC